jgi:hypothetical protein
VSSYSIFAFGASFGILLAWAISWVCSVLVEKQIAKQKREIKEQFDTEILARWLQVEKINQDAKKLGYEFKGSRARS